MTTTGLKIEIHISISYTGYYTLYVVYLNWTTLKKVIKHTDRPCLLICMLL